MLTGQNVENDIGGMGAVTERFSTGGFHRGRPAVSTALRMSTICRLPSSVLAIRHTSRLLSGRT
jgi:hypothetical protein